MNDIFHSEFEMTLISGPARGTRFPAALDWNEDDPFAVTLTMWPDEEVEWTIGRDLFLDALEHPRIAQGAGDVSMVVAPLAGILRIRLTSPEGAATVSMPLDIAQRFVDRTTRSVASGAEEIVEALDSFLADLLN